MIIKIIIYLFTFIYIFSGNICFSEDKDMVFDPKTSFLVPKYLGNVKVLRGKAFADDRELSVGMRVYPGETFKTNENSYLILEIVDETTVTIGPNSIFNVENWKFHSKNDRNAIYNIAKGQWRALIRSKSKNNSKLSIKTNLVSMGVRGTELLVNERFVDNKEMTQVALLEGSIHLQSDVIDVNKDMRPGDHEIFVKSSEGIKNIDKKLNSDEIKALNELVDKELNKLLDFATIKDSDLLATATLIQKKNENEKATSENEEMKNKKYNHTWTDTLNELNTRRLENKKKTP